MADTSPVTPTEGVWAAAAAVLSLLAGAIKLRKGRNANLEGRILKLERWKEDLMENLRTVDEVAASLPIVRSVERRLTQSEISTEEHRRENRAGMQRVQEQIADVKAALLSEMEDKFEELKRAIRSSRT